MTILEEFAALLELRALGTFKEDGSAGGTIFLAALPTTPDDAIAVARYGGPESDSRLPYDELALQIRVRGKANDARTAETKAQAVYDGLHGLGMLTLPGGTWLQLAIAAQGGPIYIGRDDNGRHEYTVNVRAEVSRPTTHRV
ncbi:MAG: minor capsid protein [Streptomyces sp.]